MAGGFDMWRFHKCSETLIPEMRRNRKWIVFWVFACFVFFFGLGIYPSIRSESRWFEVVREMLMTGDWLHPCINGQPYFDKPLVSYWFGAVVSLLAGGHVTELSVRLPSTLFALAGLACIVSVARRFYSERTAYLAGWVLLTTYSFIMWGRLAEADMEQTVFIVMAVTVYLFHREEASFWAYFVFWGCCAVGAQTKGLPALVIPPALAGIDCIVRKSFQLHQNWKFFLAMVLGGLGLYSAPFVLEALTSHNYSASGIVLVFRENLMRVFNPWDHNKDPFYIYFAYLPVLLIPWTPFFIFALIDYVHGLIRAVAKQGAASEEDLSSRKPISKDTLWLFLSIVFIFVLFSASRSRRSYYILPAVPWCALFTAAWFDEAAENRSFLRRLTDGFLKVVDVLTPAAAVILILLPAAAVAVFRSGRLSMMDQEDLKTILLSLMPAAFIAGVVWLIVWRRSRRLLLHEGGEGDFAPSADPLNRVVPFTAVTMFAVFSLVIPTFRSTATFEPTAPFLREQGRMLKNFQEVIPGFADRTAFFGSFGGSELTYYLNLEKKAYPEQAEAAEKKNDDSGSAPRNEDSRKVIWTLPMFWLEGRDDASRTFTDDTTVVYGLNDFREFLDNVRENGGAVITRGDCLEELIKSPRAGEVGKEIYDILTDETVFVSMSSPLDLFKELKLKSLRAKAEGRDDPKLEKKIKKLEGKRVIIFYHISESAPSSEQATDGAAESAPQPQAETAADGAEGTPQP